MKINNFKTIQEEDERYYARQWQEKGRAALQNTLSFYKFLGQIAEVYVPRAVEVLLFATNAGQAPAGRHRSPDMPNDGKGPGNPSAPSDGRL